jgi:hypothetical protein
MERRRPAGPWSGLHFAAEKAANGAAVMQIQPRTSVKSAFICVYLRPI